MRTIVQTALLILVVAPAVFSSPRPAPAMKHHQAMARSARHRRSLGRLNPQGTHAAGVGDASGGLLGLGLGVGVGGVNLGLGAGVAGGVGVGHAGSTHGHSASSGTHGHSTGGSTSCPSADCHKEDQFCAGGLGAPPVTCCNGTYCDTENGPESYDDNYFFNGTDPSGAEYFGYCVACDEDRNCAEPGTDDVDASGAGVCCYDSTCPPCTNPDKVTCNVQNNCLTPDTDGPSNPSSDRRRRRSIR